MVQTKSFSRHSKTVVCEDLQAYNSMPRLSNRTKTLRVWWVCTSTRVYCMYIYRRLIYNIHRIILIQLTMVIPIPMSANSGMVQQCLTYHNYQGAKRDVAARGCEVHAVAAIVAASKRQTTVAVEAINWSLEGCWDSLQWHWHGCTILCWKYDADFHPKDEAATVQINDHYLKHIQVDSTMILIHILFDDLSCSTFIFTKCLRVPVSVWYLLFWLQCSEGVLTSGLSQLQELCIQWCICACI